MRNGILNERRKMEIRVEKRDRGNLDLEANCATVSLSFLISE